MTILKKQETLSDFIQPLEKEALVTILLKKKHNLFDEKDAQAKYELLSKEQLHEKILESFESGYERFDMMYAALLNDYLNSQIPSEGLQYYVDAVIEEFNFSVKRYEEKRRHEIIYEIYDGENPIRLDILEYISESIQENESSDEELSDTELQSFIDLVFMYVIFEILYYTTDENPDFFSRQQYIKNLLGGTNE